jgi:hypothetical protein
MTFIFSSADLILSFLCSPVITNNTILNYDYICLLSSAVFLLHHYSVFEKASDRTIENHFGETLFFLIFFFFKLCLPECFLCKNLLKLHNYPILQNNRDNFHIPLPYSLHLWNTYPNLHESKISICTFILIISSKVVKFFL